jgi:hypothetical protein
MQHFQSIVFTRESLQSSAGYMITSCFFVAVAVAVVCLLVLYSMKQFNNLTLQQGNQARMQFGILPLQQGNSRRVHAVWYPVTASGSLVSCHCKWQFGILPLQVAVWYPATAAGQQPPPRACSLVSCHCSRATAAACMQFGILPLEVTAECLYAV